MKKKKTFQISEVTVDKNCKIRAGKCPKQYKEKIRPILYIKKNTKKKFNPFFT